MQGEVLTNLYFDFTAERTQSPVEVARNIEAEPSLENLESFDSITDNEASSEESDDHADGISRETSVNEDLVSRCCDCIFTHFFCPESLYPTITLN